MSAAMRALCAEDSESRKPKVPSTCPFGKHPSEDINLHLAYHGGFAGLWVANCNGGCSSPINFWIPVQELPSHELRRRIVALDEEERAQARGKTKGIDEQDSANVTPKKKDAVKVETTPKNKGAVKTEGTPQKDPRTPKKATVTPHRPDSQALASTPKEATPRKESSAQRGSIYDDKGNQNKAVSPKKTSNSTKEATPDDRAEQRVSDKKAKRKLDAQQPETSDEESNIPPPPSQMKRKYRAREPETSEDDSAVQSDVKSREGEERLAAESSGDEPAVLMKGAPKKIYRILKGSQAGQRHVGYPYPIASSSKHKMVNTLQSKDTASPSKKRKVLPAPIDVIEISSTDEDMTKGNGKGNGNGNGKGKGKGKGNDKGKGKGKGKGKAKADSEGEGEGQSEAEVENEVERGPMTSDDVIELSSDEE